MLANFFVPILKDGWRFIAIFAGVTFLAALTGLAWLFWPLFVLTLWSIYFFRDPPRGVPQEDRLLIAPADGLVQMVVDAVPPAELGIGDQRLTRVSIFLSVFDVHINRSPCAGTVDVVAYRPGKFVNAAADKASEDNERMAIALKRNDGVTVGFVQIAGWVARRIVCYIKPGQAVLVVSNTGPVVPAYEIDNLFEPFRRLRTERTGSDKGVGLGLSIARSVARAHGGRIIAEPREGGGLVMRVSLPV